jgi:hypothetical protein
MWVKKPFSILMIDCIYFLKWTSCMYILRTIQQEMDLLPNEQNFDLDRSRQKFHYRFTAWKSITKLVIFRNISNKKYFWYFFQVLLYDIRSDKPVLVKDHQYGLPINSLAFQNDVNMVLSTDSKILKIWHRDSVRWRNIHYFISCNQRTFILAFLPILMNYCIEK